MSDVNPEPRPWQVWAFRLDQRDQRDYAVVLVRPVRDRWWLAYDLSSGSRCDVMPEVRTYLRDATPSERKAAGLPEEPIGCVPTMADLAAVRAERDSAAKRVAELEAQVDALTKERDRARDHSRVNAEAWGVKCDEVLAVKARAEKAEAQRDAYLDGREMQRARADSAEAQANALVADYGAMLQRAERAEAALESLKARSHSAYLAWQAEKAALSAPPAPSLDAAECEFVRALVASWASRNTGPIEPVFDAAKRAAKEAPRV